MSFLSVQNIYHNPFLTFVSSSFFLTTNTGTVCIGTFGLRGSVTNDNAAAAIDAAGAIIFQLHKIGIKASIGEYVFRLPFTFVCCLCDSVFCVFFCDVRTHCTNGTLATNCTLAATFIFLETPMCLLGFDEQLTYCIVTLALFFSSHMPFLTF